ncbi:putative reverse transcriptase domain-containing protein [Tanacetum coccineum]
MPSRKKTQATIEKLIADAIARDQATRSNPSRAGGSRGNNGDQGGAPPIRECTYASFMKCDPINFLGVEGAVELYHWFEKTKSVFSISEWLEVANEKSWAKMKTMMKEEFCPPEEIQRMEIELWNLRVKDSNIASYTHRFNELIMLCPYSVPNENKKIKAYIRRLPKKVKGETTSSRPTTLNEAVRMAHTLTKQKLQAKAKRVAESNKRKAMTTAQNEGANQTGTAPKCNRYGLCHFGQCSSKCNNCGRMGHKTKDCRSQNVATGANARPVINCYECGEGGHTRAKCLKRDDRQGGNAQDRAYVIHDAENNQGPNVVTVIDLGDHLCLITMGSDQMHRFGGIVESKKMQKKSMGRFLGGSKSIRMRSIWIGPKKSSAFIGFKLPVS